MKRRGFLQWLANIFAGYFGLAASSALPPLVRINTVRLGEARAQTPPPEPCVCEANDECLCEGNDGPITCPTDGATEPCGTDSCTTRDMCESGDAGHTCHVADSCDIDESGDCLNDSCVSDRSYACHTDSCETDSSGLCRGDSCTTRDISGDCNSDLCIEDGSKACLADKCDADASGWCTSDQCPDDSSGDCVGDKCEIGDASGTCVSDSCDEDSSGYCKSDLCPSDRSGGCRSDKCESDKSGACKGDICTSDTSQGCTSDLCTGDASGACYADKCASDSSGACESDLCSVADASKSCESDLCHVADVSGEGKNDSCNTDKSGDCSEQDVCVLDASSSCPSDLCRDDRTPEGSECTTSDSCALDLAMNDPLSRRKLARAGVNAAIKWLYRLSALILLVPTFPDSLQSATVIDAQDAVFYPAASFVPEGTVNVPSPVGAFLRDCDGDNVAEADTNGDGQCAGDAEIKDYNADGSRELPSGTVFAGDYQYSCFHIPDDVAIVATGPLTVGASREMAIFGSVRLPTTGAFSTPTTIDLRTSAWLSEDASEPAFTTALSGSVNESQIGYFPGGVVPALRFTSLCNSGITIEPTFGLITSESGDTDKFNVFLDHQPTGDVVLGFSSSDPGEGTVSPTSLTFTATNWQLPQVVTVAGVDDGVADENQLYQVITVVKSSADPDFATNNPEDVNVINVDPANGCAGAQVVVTAADTPSGVQLYCVASESIQLQSGVDINTDAHVELYAPVHSVPGTLRVEERSTLILRR